MGLHVLAVGAMGTLVARGAERTLIEGALTDFARCHICGVSTGFLAEVQAVVDFNDQRVLGELVKILREYPICDIWV